MEQRRNIALVCASSKGLGKACAESLLDSGATVVICSRQLDNVKTAEEELRAKYGDRVIGVCVDLTKEEDIQTLFNEVMRRFGRLDILVTNTPGPRLGSFADMSDSDFLTANETLVIPPVRLIRLALPSMKENRFGRIVIIASKTVKEPSKSILLSNMYRVALVSLAKALSKEIASDNIMINTVCPGSFKTDRYRSILERKATSEKSVAVLEKEDATKIPLGRVQDPSELGRVVSFLASDTCFLTGTTINVDGGASSSLF